ncbi:hypothetical protein [Almyronema epifaneia]|uniref:RiboL-PSP-HEPN domain-containing protein n=1 Tax=Almyronema epifaneia S1 TaxID=2991925 RepID=A0ABW6ICC5_9CYAN
MYAWFPDTAYEYAILLEDYHSREPSELRKKYFEATHEDNMYQYFASQEPPVFEPTSDWQPITILLFRSIYELLLDHLLWKLIRIELSPSGSAEDYACFVMSQFSSVSAKKDKCYKFVTGNKWSDDIKEFKAQNLDALLEESVKVRNEFIHRNPLAGSNNQDLADRSREAIPDLFELFVKLANKYYYPVAKDLSYIEIKRVPDTQDGI